MTAMTTAGLNPVRQALTIHDRTLRFAVCTRRFQEMFAPPSGITLRTHPGTKMAATCRMRDLLLNLVFDARDACAGLGRITNTARPVQGTWPAFVVADTGPGSSSEALAHALDPFFNTKARLCLSVVYNMTTLADRQAGRQDAVVARALGAGCKTPPPETRVRPIRA